MYTLTRKLSVVCLTVVLSFLVYGCGGSSKQALITDVNLDMVTVDLTPDSGTYIIQPGGTANAGDVTFACPAEGAPCEVTVAEDGTITSGPGSAPGMVTAMDSASAEARLIAEEERDTAVAAAMTAEEERDTAVAAAMTAETDRDTKVAAAETERDTAVAAAETERDTAVAAAMTAGTDRDTKVAAAETDRDTKVAAAETERDNKVAAAETERATAVAAAMTAETDRDTKVAAAETERDNKVAAAETERATAVAAAMTAETDRDTKVAAAETDRDNKVAAAETERDTKVAAAETERATAVAAAMTAGTDRDTKVAAAETDRDTKVAAAETERDTKVVAAETERATAVAAAMTAETDRDTKVAAAETDRDTKVAAAEKEKDAALAVAMIAVARAELLQTVTQIVIDGDPEFIIVTPGVYEIASGEKNTAPGDDITFSCPDGGPLCVVIVTVNDTGISYTSLGGAATGANSVSAKGTIVALALHGPVRPGDPDEIDASTILTMGGGGGVDANNRPDTITVKRSTDGSETTIMLTTDDDTVKYTSQAVDTGHEIDDWSGQTLKRSSSDGEAQEATFYTNIDPATPRKLKLGDDATTDVGVPRASATNVYLLDSGQDVDMDTRMFRATYNGIPGTFTCAALVINCAPIMTATNNGGQTFITEMTLFVTSAPGGWTFESDDNVETVALPDADYMYFGYWLQSADPDETTSNYEFATFFGPGPVNDFNVPMALTAQKDAGDDALTATYVGGAAGRYVTRKLRVKAPLVDPNSPGYYGRFTAKATLTAHFGVHDDFVDADVGASHNSIGGTITDFTDGAKDLGFEVILVRAMGNIVAGDGEMVPGTATAKFNETTTSTTATDNTGTWNAQFYGPSAETLNADATAEERVPTADAATTMPSGVAGDFNVSSLYTAVVGAFAAEKK